MVQLDLILPPIIVGMLIILIFRVNSFMMDSSIDNRIFNDMQNFAETAAVVLDDQLRMAKEIENKTVFDNTMPCENFKVDGSADTNCSDKLEFLTTTDYKITIEKDNVANTIRIISKELETGDENEMVYPLYVSKLEFQYKETSEPNFIRYKIETESDPNHHVQTGQDQQTVKGFAERKVLLRTKALKN